MSLLAELGIRYIVGHGNLLEIERVRHGLPPTATTTTSTCESMSATCVLNTVVTANEMTCVRFGQTTRHHVYDTLRALNQPS